MSEQRHTPLTVPHLNTRVIGRRIFVLDEVDSTNNYALRLGGEGTVIVADRQTGGRGRQGRVWHSAGGMGLWFSIALEGLVPGIAFAAPLSVRDALRPRVQADLKWPNDVLIGGRKVCGILVEHRNGVTALGIGINVHHRPEDFPEELRETAASIEAATGLTFTRTKVLRDVLTDLDAKVKVLREGGYEGIRQAWADACCVLGRQIQCGDTLGIVDEIDAHGALIVTTPHGSRRIVAGEIEPA
ncbi:MAG: biotin--[acetyl-CoA-carboxylase] ligase [FCB group bacterium]|jgi:BirA family biotin operon repressor/biotin-[acetyl-CoA-carboxylase] ligase|nr:biotin--[acetyl-CoA-carboxylase] ligase [FCB group bacterium]